MRAGNKLYESTQVTQEAHINMQTTQDITLVPNILTLKDMELTIRVRKPSSGSWSEKYDYTGEGTQLVQTKVGRTCQNLTEFS